MNTCRNIRRNKQRRKDRQKQLMPFNLDRLKHKPTDWNPNADLSAISVGDAE
jgi:hypothetical protein